MAAKRKHIKRERRTDVPGDWIDELLLTGETPEGQNPFLKFITTRLRAEWQQRRERLLRQYPRDEIWAARQFEDRPFPTQRQEHKL